MSTPTCRVALGAALALSACAVPVDVSRLAPDSVLLVEDVVVAGPPGYCVAPGTVREADGAAFVVLGSCASLSDGALGAAPAQPGVLTVLVSAAGEGAPLSAASSDDLEAFFESDAGRSALSPDGQAATVEVIEARAGVGQVFVRARDLSGQRPAGIDPEYWRALVDVRGHLVTATLIGFETDPLDPGLGLRTLSDLTDRLLRENPPSLEE
ncbi:MAG: hypothetical protein AAGM21_08160 [Pseudomonadota bacterium]